MLTVLWAHALVRTRDAIPIFRKVLLRMRAGGALDREGPRYCCRKLVGLVSATSAFDALDMSPLAYTAGDFVIAVLLETRQ